MNSQSKIIELFLLLSFSSVQVISIACTLVRFGHELMHKSHSHESHHYGQESNQEHETTDSCCVENVSIFLQGIEALKERLVYSLSTSFVLVQALYSFSFTIISLENKEDISIRPPPVCLAENSSFVRILLQSFLL